MSSRAPSLTAIQYSILFWLSSVTLVPPPWTPPLVSNRLPMLRGPRLRLAYWLLALRTSGSASTMGQSTCSRGGSPRFMVCSSRLAANSHVSMATWALLVGETP